MKQLCLIVFNFHFCLFSWQTYFARVLRCKADVCLFRLFFEWFYYSRINEVSRNFYGIWMFSCRGWVIIVTIKYFPVKTHPISAIPHYQDKEKILVNSQSPKTEYVYWKNLLEKKFLVKVGSKSLLPWLSVETVKCLYKNFLRYEKYF